MNRIPSENSGSDAKSVIVDYTAPTPCPTYQPIPEPAWWRYVPGIFLRSRRRENRRTAKTNHVRRIEEWEAAGRVAKHRMVVPRANITYGPRPGEFTIQATSNTNPALLFGEENER